MKETDTKAETTTPDKERVVAVLTRHRTVITIAANLGILAASYASAFLLRFDFTLPPAQIDRLLITFGPVVLIHYAAFYALNVTRGWWRYVGLGDFILIVKAAIAGGVGLALLVLLVYRKDYPRSIIALNAILVVGLSVGFRLAARMLRHGLTGDPHDDKRRRLLIIGAGDTGEALLREIRQSSRLHFQVVAFLDDAANKRGALINGVPVVDTIEHVLAATQRHQIDEIIVAAPSASGAEMRRITELCRTTGKPFRVMPATWEVLNGKAGLGAAREVQITDLLRRPQVELDRAGIQEMLRGKRVLVTGAAGSIGSEIVRQVAQYAPASLTCLDHDENALFFLQRGLSDSQIDQNPRYVLADITDERRLAAIFAAEKPEIVYHAAAHKHVPMIEANPVEGVRNNVFGTETLATVAARHGAKAFVLISTDKAVNPTSIMGTTKRVSELLIQTLPFPETLFTAVRFGNVLGSQGSVVPIMKEQIAKGGPVTITHPEMCRYFMTIPEAVELVLQTSSLAEAKRVYMLDMGDPVKIIDLAKDLIILSGHEPNVDIEITFTGIRPGEKLYEELYLDAEETEKTRHEKIFAARHRAFDSEEFGRDLEQLRSAVDKFDEPNVRRLLHRLVPEYARRVSEERKVIPITEAPPSRRVSSSIS